MKYLNEIIIIIIYIQIDIVINKYLIIILIHIIKLYYIVINEVVLSINNDSVERYTYLY